MKENSPHRMISLDNVILYQKTQALAKSCFIYYKDILNNNDYNQLVLMLFRLNSKIAQAFAVVGSKGAYIAQINSAFRHYIDIQALFINPSPEIQEQLDDLSIVIIKFRTKYRKESNKYEHRI